MSENNPPVNRIPHESIVDDSVSSWSLPAMKGAVSTETSDIKKKVGMHIRGRAVSAAANKESIEKVHPDATPKSLTAEDLKLITEDAHKEGYGDGYAEGIRKGTKKGIDKGTQQGKDQAYKETKSEMIDLQNRLRDISKNLLDPMNQQDQALENIVVEMAFFFAQSILESEISQSPAKLYSLVNKALSTMPVGAKNISVKLNNSDADLLENILPKSDRSWNIQRDDSLKSGGCIVQSKESLIDYSVDSRIAKFMDDATSLDDAIFAEPLDVKGWREDEAHVADKSSEQDEQKIDGDDSDKESTEKDRVVADTEVSKADVPEPSTSAVKNSLLESNDPIDDSFNESESDN